MTTFVVYDDNGAPCEAQCGLCWDMTPWVVDVRAGDNLISICIECVRNMSLAALELKEQMADSQA